MIVRHISLISMKNTETILFRMKRLRTYLRVKARKGMTLEM